MFRIPCLSYFRSPGSKEAGASENALVPLQILVPEEVECTLRLISPTQVIGHIIGKAGANIKLIKASIGGTLTIEPCVHPGITSSFHTYKCVRYMHYCMILRMQSFSC